MKDIPIHPDSKYALEYHFGKSKNHLRPLFDLLINRLSKDLKFELKIGKTYIGLINKLVFAAIYVQTRQMIFEFVPRKEFKSPRIIKTKKFQRARWAQYIKITNDADIDQELLDWVKFSYE